MLIGGNRNNFHSIWILPTVEGKTETKELPLSYVLLAAYYHVVDLMISIETPYVAGVSMCSTDHQD
jgi:hypothetical protein